MPSAATERPVIPTQLEILEKLSKDIKTAATNLGKVEARQLVDLYYQMQNFRIATAGQVRSIEQSGANEPSATLSYFLSSFQQLETNIRKILDIYTSNDPVGQWCKSITGIGPVIAAGLIANLDVKDKPTAGHFWSYCGLNDYNRPWLGRTKTTEIVNEILKDKSNKAITYEDFVMCCKKTQWNPNSVEKAVDGKGNPIFIKDGKYKFTKDNIIKQLSKRPYNDRMKILCWKIGESFQKVSNNPNDFYGKIYQQRKVYETLKNENKEYKEQAAEKLKIVGKTTEAYKSYIEDMLPPGHILSRCKRYAVKIFLSHLHQVMYMVEYGKMPPRPFALEILGHAHEIKCPNIDVITNYVVKSS